MSDALRASITAATTAAYRFHSDSNESNASSLDAHLGKLVELTSILDTSARLSIHDRQLCDLLRYCSMLLNGISTSAVTRSRLHLFLFNLAFHNISIRRYLAGENLQICGSVFECLKLSLREQLGPQNLIDVLRLLQVLTYERNVVLGIWTNDLISFLLSEVTCDDEPEWLPYCIAILCNLAARSKSACLRIRKSSSYKAFTHKLLKLLAHDSRTVVISSLVLVGFLEEKLRDMVFCSRNIPQTFRCVFNVLILGDHLMTRHIAVDLLKRLIINDCSDISSLPTITSTGKDLVSYSYFENTIQLVAGLFVQIDPRTEESFKVYDLFLSFCSMAQLRSATVQAVLRCSVHKERLTTPILAIYNTSNLSFDEAIEPEIPLKALRLLIYLLQELIENDGHVQDVLPTEHVLRLIENNTKTAIETVSNFVKFQCQRITEGLRLAETVSNDDETRTYLFEVVSAPLCSHIIESQMISNTVVTYVGQPAMQRSGSLPEWCVDGVAVVLKLLRVLTILKDHSKPHKDLYWKILKDDRLVPFIAYAVVDGSADLTHEALLLYIHCAQSHTFPTKWLGDLIASYREEKILTSNAARICLSRDTSEVSLNGDVGGFAVDNKKTPSDRLINKGETAKQVGDPPDKLQLENVLKDPRVSQLLNMYEKEVRTLKIREEELERIVAKMEESLRHHEDHNLRNKEDSENEIISLRKLVADCEKKIENLNELLTSLYSEKREAEETCEAYRKIVEDKKMELAVLSDELEKMTQEKNILQEENKSERELATLAKSRYDELKKKFAQASDALINKDKECVQLVNEFKILELNLVAKKAENSEMAESLKHAQRKLEEITNTKDSEVKCLKNLLDGKAEEIERLSKELQKVLKFKDQMMQMMNEI
uniref:Protein CIP2A n=1 Tax=Wuchereria bancrofti TaxID=6293 RepID=A0AAF5Q257_WUCBA